MKTIRIAVCDSLETGFSVPVVKTMPPTGKARRRLTSDGEWVEDPIARGLVSTPHSGANTVRIVPVAQRKEI